MLSVVVLFIIGHRCPQSVLINQEKKSCMVFYFYMHACCSFSVDMVCSPFGHPSNLFCNTHAVLKIREYSQTFPIIPSDNPQF